MRSTSVTNPAVRTASGRATFYDERLRFAKLGGSETISPIWAYDASDDGLLRTALVGSALYYETGASPNMAGTWTLIGTTMSLSRAAVFGSTIFFQRTNGDVVSGSVGSYTVRFNMAEPVSIAPVSATSFYVFRQMRGYLTVSFYNGTLTALGITIQWKISDLDLYKGTPICDAVSFGGYDYVYFGDESRARWFKVLGNSISAIQYVVPIDIVDDMSLFRLASAQVINNQVFVTGVLKRTYGLAMHIYTIGPEEFTMGRELVIRPEQLTSCGKFALYGSDLYYVGPNIRFMSDATRLVGVDNALRKLQTSEVVGANYSQVIGDVANLSLDMPSKILHAAVRTGSRLVYESCINGNYYKVGEFCVEAVTRPQNDTGASLSIAARSWSMKAVNQWESDASYDYWSQTKLSLNPKGMTDFLRVTGQYEDNGGALSIKNLNVPGFLYASANASRNGIATGRFTQIVGDFTTNFGVGINYYRETKFEAAKRLAKDSEDVQEDEYGNNGIFAIWGSKQFSGAAGIGLYEVYNNTWTLLTSVASTQTPGTAFEIMLQQHEGHLKVSKRVSSTTWTTVITQKYLGSKLWKTVEEGRGALYLTAVTPNSVSYPFGQQDDFIPVESNATFPTTDIVVVDDEHINYSGKSQNVTVPSLRYRYGNLFLDASNVGTSTVNFANSRVTSRLIQTISLGGGTYYCTAIKIFVKKVGYPEDGLEVVLRDHTITVGNPIGGEMGRAIVDSNQVAAAGSWVVARFPKIQLVSGDLIVLEREHDANHPSSSTYYSTTLTAGDYGGMETVYFNEDEDGPGPWTGGHPGWTDLTPSGELPFQIFGDSKQPGEEFIIHVAHDAALSSTADYYKGQAITVTAGSDVGSTYKITRYEHGTDTCLFCVDRSPDDMDETSILKVVPVLNVTMGGRGVSTIPSPHLASLCSVYRTGPYLKCDLAQFFSGEQDRSLFDMLNTIARKAGVLTSNSKMLVDGSYTATPAANRKNFVVQFTFGVNSVQIYGRKDLVNSVMVEVSNGTVKFYINGIILDTVDISDRSIPSSAQILVSFFDQFVSVWQDGRLLASFAMDADTAALTSDGISCTSATATHFHISEACPRYDNFILDAGRKGAQLVSDLIGEKRFFVQDDENGNLWMYASRATVNTSLTPYLMAVSQDVTDTDISLITRLRLEGTDANEQYDTDMMIEHGNLYHQSNQMEINSPADAAYYTGVMLDEYGSRMISKAFSGSVEPKVEAGDIFYIQTPGGTFKVLVDMVGLAMSAEGQFEMTLSGRIPRSDL